MPHPTLEDTTDSCYTSLTHREREICTSVMSSSTLKSTTQQERGERIYMNTREGGETERNECKSHSVWRWRVHRGQEVWTHCETNADSGSEGPWDELALVILNQQRGLAHSTVSHQDCLQRQKDATSCILAPLLMPHRLA